MNLQMRYELDRAEDAGDTLSGLFTQDSGSRLKRLSLTRRVAESRERDPGY